MVASLAVTAQEIEEILRTTPFAKIYNFKLASLGDGECTLHVPFAKETERPGGIIAGPVYIAAADAAIWLAIMTKLGAKVQTVTTELNTTFLRPAREQAIAVAARVLKLGRSQIFCVAECRTLDDDLLTHHTSTYARVATAP